MHSQLRSALNHRVQFAARGAWAFAAVLLAVFTVLAQAPLQHQSIVLPPMKRAGIHAVAYDVSASIQPANQSITSRAIIDLEARQSSSTVELELHPALHVDSIRDASGRQVRLERDEREPMLQRAMLNDTLPAGQRTRLIVEYSGSLASDDQSPVPGVRLAHISPDNATLLLPGRWFPLTEYPSNRYTGVFHIEVPQGFLVTGTGTAEAPAPAQLPRTVGPQAAVNQSPARIVYTFRTSAPEAAGTFIAGDLKLASVKAQGISISVYTPPASANLAQVYGDAAAQIVTFFSGQFGPLAQPGLSLVVIPDGSLESFSAPGVIILSRHLFTSAVNNRVLANQIAAQWWGNQVMAATPSDTWLTDGLARFSEALFVEDTDGKGGMDRAVDDFAVGALMYESAAPIAEAGRMTPFTPDYNSVVINKGAMVYNMLREQLGDMTFEAMLRDFFSKYSGSAASLNDFEALARTWAAKRSSGGAPATTIALRSDNTTVPLTASGEAATGPLNLAPFFAQWIHSTGVPEFTLTYTVFRTKRGFKIVGKVRQNLDFFRMPVEMQVQTEGNPELKIIEVSGLDSSFETEVFGRPKPNGIVLDPHNYILKSSDRLRTRALIARGEALAEQGRFYEALQQYGQALNEAKNNSLAAFRSGEAFFYQRNYSAAANSFRDSLDGDLDPSYKWVEVWSHIYLGKIYDVAGDRTRAVNEYTKAEQTSDNTGGAQDQAKRYISAAYTEGN